MSNEVTIEMREAALRAFYAEPTGVHLEPEEALDLRIHAAIEAALRVMLREREE